MLTKPESIQPTGSSFAPVVDWTLIPRTNEAGAVSAATWRDKVEELATRLLEADEALSDPRWRGPMVSPGLGHGPRLVFEDHSEIPMSPTDTQALEYRMSWLARSSDVVGLAEERVPPFEHHLARHYALGQPRYVRPRHDTHRSMAPRFVDDSDALNTLLGLAGSGELSVVPYIATRSVWLLAERLAALSGQAVRVAGPPPDVVDRANNKLWFAQRVRELIGRHALPVTRVASDDRELVSQLAALATVGERIVVKVPAGSGGRGIVTCDVDEIAPGRAAAAALRMRSRLEAGGWEGDFPLVIGLWDAPVVASPSVQVWVPPVDEGLPIIEAIFDQTVDGAKFVGAAESTLPVHVRSRLSSESMGLALLLQRLGYFGRCGFDAVLVGETVDRAQVHWLECNGRWGSVSTALSALRRLVGVRPDRACAVVQSEEPLSGRRSFEEVLALLDADSLHRRRDLTGAVILAPRRVMTGTGVNLAVVERSGVMAAQMASQILGRLAGR